MTILTAGVDTAKNGFAVHGVDASGTVQLRQPTVARAKLNALVASLPPCTMGKAMRTQTLKRPKDDAIDVVASDEVKRFDQIKVGDSIVASYFEALAVSLEPARPAAAKK